MLRTLFWVAAVIVSGAVAYVVTVPGAGDSLMGESTTIGGDPEPVVAESTETPAPEEGAADEAEPEVPAQTDPDEAQERARLAVREAPLLPDPPAAAPAEPRTETPREILAPDEDELAAAPAAPPPEVELAGLEIGTLPFDAECGLQLRRRGGSDIVFASGISLDPEAGGPAAMHIDGELVPLRRVTTDGEPIGYSQYGRQLFEDESGAVIVAMSIDLEEEELLDSARVSDGAITVMKAERATMRLEVDGRVGC